MKIIEPSDDIATILKEDKNKNMLSFLYFTAKWCGPCNRIFPVLLTLEDEYNKSIQKNKENKDISDSSSSEEEYLSEEEDVLLKEEDKSNELEEFEDNSKIVFYKIDIDENSEYADEYKIRSVPTFLLFNGEEKLGETSGADIKKIGKLIKDNL